MPSRGLFILRGKNGTGKTTLLSMLSGRDRSFEGALNLNGEALSGNDLERYAEEYVSCCPLDQLIFDNEKTIDNVLIPFAIFKFAKEKTPMRLEAPGLGLFLFNRLIA